MTFIKPYLIRLSHCDPTGFVFYPNYFHIFNALVEDWFYEALEIPFDVFLMERRLSLPTVRLETTFTKPTRMGETVDFWLTATHIGRTSLRLTMGVDKNTEPRVRMTRVTVCIRKPIARSTFPRTCAARSRSSCAADSRSRSGLFFPKARNLRLVGAREGTIEQLSHPGLGARLGVDLGLGRAVPTGVGSLPHGCPVGALVKVPQASLAPHRQQLVQEQRSLQALLDGG